MWNSSKEQFNTPMSRMFRLSPRKEQLESTTKSDPIRSGSVMKTSCAKEQDGIAKKSGCVLFSYIQIYVLTYNRSSVLLCIPWAARDLSYLCQLKSSGPV